MLSQGPPQEIPARLSSGNGDFFSLTALDSDTSARAAVLRVGGLEVATPVFMPVGTLGSVKGIWSTDLAEIGFRLILGNTYHLALRPGSKLIEELGGLKKFMSWPHAVLTDSGGYQVFSLADRLRFLPEGVEFQSHIDGSRLLFTPRRVIDLQGQFQSDISMVLDDCPPAYAPLERLQISLDRTHRWAKESFLHFQDLKEKKGLGEKKHIFGIVQGGQNEALRQESLDFIQGLPFDGIALGGLSVGENRRDLHALLAFLAPRLDKSRPRYLMGVGSLPDILEAVKNGIDMFDCVLPTRNARNGQAFTSNGVLKLRNEMHKNTDSALDPDCACRVCRLYSRAYIRHLFIAQEMLGPMMLTYHNLFFYFHFMVKMRQAIIERRFLGFYRHWRSVWKDSEGLDESTA